MGVYPVRVAFPATLSARELASSAFGPLAPTARARRSRVSTAAASTVALLDTGVDGARPVLRPRARRGRRHRRRPGRTCGAAEPSDPTQLERHGTEMAGLLVGGGGPGGLTGAATGAAVLPIRVAAWQPDPPGGYAVYAWSDQLLAGLERAVDPNGDGDAHDAARVARAALVEPFAAFTDGPQARAAAGALDPRHARRRAGR